MAKRISNSKSKTKQLETKALEQQTKKMEEKLSELKKFMEEQKKNRDEQGKMNESASRWKAAASTAEVPLRNYAQKILDEQKEAMKKFLSTNKKLTGLKTMKLPSDKRKNEEQSAQSQKMSEEDHKQSQNTFNILGGFQLDSNPQPIANKLGKAKVQQTTVVYDDREVAYEPPQQIEVKHEVEEYENDFELSYSQSKLEERQEEKSEEPAQTVSNNPSNSLLQGSYDEERNRRQFEEAVLAYRGVIQKIEEYSIQTEEKPQSAASVCFNCYRTTAQPVQFLGRHFCSDKCLHKYKSDLSVSCATCHKSFLKLEGICLDGVWLCSAGCNTNNAEMERLFLQWRMEERNASFEDSLEA